ncbi:class II fructose-bisphosphate aldolase [Cohnella herbarum]|uniref:Class II fructose-bisphosphate aldolase family protein n=1 Tax=Cohnella herbarum TaxID=2728023 RepID=A0A7Z2VQA0_9BACL|nr:class II fructose-bisphosphate aldolase [Cohnella herbarum]QJD87149.1 class II fructose-bisphosphate aldolase family protein [Cohnella herbarum]
MALVNMNDMLLRARQENYAVGAFDLINLEFAEAIIAGAVQRRAPVILSTAAVHFDYVNMKSLAPSLVRLAEEAPIPVALHLDHGTDLEMAIQAIRLGYTGIQIDTAHLPFEDNIRQTREVVKVAHAVGVSVEGELGYVSGHEGDHSSRVVGEEPIYTDAEQAAAFATATGVDCLAVSVGTVHGLMKGEPRIDFERLRSIRDRISVPLVIHGGSGLTANTYGQLVSNGMCKINFYAELSKAAVDSIRNRLSLHSGTNSITQALADMRSAVQQSVERKIEIWGCGGKA